MITVMQLEESDQKLSTNEIRTALSLLDSPETCIWFAARCALRVLPLAMGEGVIDQRSEHWFMEHGKSLVAASFAAFCRARDGVSEAGLLKSRGPLQNYFAFATETAASAADAAAYSAFVTKTAARAAKVAACGARAAADVTRAAAYATDAAAYATDGATYGSAPYYDKYRTEIRFDVKSAQTLSLAELLRLPLWNADQPEAWSAFLISANQVLVQLDANLPGLLSGLEEGRPDWVGIENWLQAWYEDYQQQEASGQAAGPVAPEPAETASENSISQAQASASLDQTSAETLASIDRLNRSRIIDALRQLIAEREGDQHFALGLFGNWGSGKSSTIEQLKKQLNQQHPEIVIAEFNAWKNEKASNLAAMLAQTVVEALSGGLGFCGKLGLVVRLSAKRHARFASDLKQDAGKTWAWVALPPVLALLVVGLLLWAIPIADGLWLETTLKWLIATGAGIALTYKSLAAFLKDNLTEFFKRVGVERPATLWQLPSYNDQRGLLGEIHLTLKALCELRLGEGKDRAGKQLLLVVDDLDRCGIDAVKEVLDAVRLVADIPGVMTLVAIDERMAFAAVEKHYQQFGHAGRPPALVAREYLAKVLQASIALPEVGEAEIHAYVGQVLFPGVADFVAEAPASTAKGVAAEVIAGVVPEAVVLETSDEQGRISPLAESSAPILPADEMPKAASPAGSIAVQARALPEELALFRSLATAYRFGNPRLLWRMHFSWRLFKSLYLGSGIYGFEQIELPMRLFFWREYCLQQDGKQRREYEAWLERGCESEGPKHLREALGGLKDVKQASLLGLSWAQCAALVDAVLLPASVPVQSDAKPAG